MYVRSIPLKGIFSHNECHEWRQNEVSMLKVLSFFLPHSPSIALRALLTTGALAVRLSAQAW